MKLLVVVLDHILISVSPTSRDRLAVRTLRCGRNNPGSNPGHGIFPPFLFSYFHSPSFFSTLVCYWYDLLILVSLIKTWPVLKNNV